MSLYQVFWVILNYVDERFRKEIENFFQKTIDKKGEVCYNNRVNGSNVHLGAS